MIPFRQLVSPTALIAFYAYAVALGAAYVISFWRPFGLDIFSYLTVQDILTLPLNRLVILLAPFFLVMAILFFGGGKPTLRNARIWFLTILAMHIIACAREFYETFTFAQQIGFTYENEKSILLLGALLPVISLTIAPQVWSDIHRRDIAVMSLVLCHLSLALLTGLGDGKNALVGNTRAFFLENYEICSPNQRTTWVYVQHFGGKTFFVHAIDKRICVTDQSNYRLIPRHMLENVET